jgi:hypothetical protein
VSNLSAAGHLGASFGAFPAAESTCDCRHHSAPDRSLGEGTTSDNIGKTREIPAKASVPRWATKKTSTKPMDIWANDGRVWSGQPQQCRKNGGFQQHSGSAVECRGPYRGRQCRSAAQPLECDSEYRPSEIGRFGLVVG